MAEIFATYKYLQFRFCLIQGDIYIQLNFPLLLLLLVSTSSGPILSIEDWDTVDITEKYFFVMTTQVGYPWFPNAPETTPSKTIPVYIIFLPPHQRFELFPLFIQGVHNLDRLLIQPTLVLLKTAIG